MARRSGSSSPSTRLVDRVLGYVGREGDCSRCRREQMRRVLATYVVPFEGRRIQVGNLIALECPRCGHREHYSRELERAREIARIRARDRQAA